MITVIKNIRMFAPTSILRGGQTRQISAGIFYALADHIYGFVPPCGALMRPLPLRCSSTGKAEPLFFCPNKYKRDGTTRHKRPRKRNSRTSS